MMEIQRNPLFRLDDIHDLTKDQLRERTMAKLCVQLIRLCEQAKARDRRARRSCVFSLTLQDFPDFVRCR